MLNYKASNIAKAERELGANFFTTLQEVGDGMPSISSLLFILMAGGLNEDDADELIDQKGLEAVMTEVIDALGRSGFLAKAAGKTQAELQKEIKSAVETSQSTGAATKA